MYVYYRADNTVNYMALQSASLWKENTYKLISTPIGNR